MQKMRLRPTLRPGSHWRTHDALPNPIVGWEKTPLPNHHPTKEKRTESIGSASEYGPEYTENAFVKRKNIVGSVVHVAELN